MRYTIVILFLLIGFVANAQQRFPAGVPTQLSTGWFKQGYQQSDSGTIVANRDTTWKARFSGTVVFRPGDKRFYYFDSTTLFWYPLVPTAIDTTSLSNRINTKLNITDTTAKWWGIGKRWVDTVYRVNDSTVGFTINNGTQQTFQILGRTSGGGGGGSGTVTSVALSMPSAFSVSGSPITSSGTFNISGAGTTAQYIRGNGTLATTDTGMIPNFHLKVRGLFSGTSPISVNQTTGIISIPNANILGTKGAATFKNSDFADNGSGLISLSTLVTGGTCTSCTITFRTDGRAAAYSSGVAPSGSSVDTIFRTSGIDSIFYKINSVQYAIKDSIGSGGGSDVAINVFQDTAFVPLIIMFGEDNASGAGNNSFATSGEIDADPKVQIMQPGGAFDTLDIGANNNLTTSGNHGWELELQNLIPTVFNGRTVYLVKAGATVSKILQWQFGTQNYDTLTNRVNNALNRLREIRKTPAIVFWYSQGISDGIDGTDPDEWYDLTLRLFRDVRSAYGYAPIIMTELIGDRATYPNIDAIDQKIVDLSADKNLYIYRVQTPQGPSGSLATDSLLADEVHWQYLGLKAITDRMTNVMMDTAGYLNYYYGIKNITNTAWNINGNRRVDISGNFLGTLDTAQLVFKTNNIEAFRITSDQQWIAIGKLVPTKILDINGDISVNGLNLGRGGGNELTNSAFGENALVNNSSGSVNVSIGGLSLNQNTTGFGNVAIGYQAGNANQTGNVNVFIGFQSGIGVLGSGNVMIGSQAGNTVSYSNKFFLSNSNISNLLYGDFSSKALVVNPGSTPVDNGVGTLQVKGKITVDSHTLGSNSDSAVIWDRTTNEYKVAKINGGSSTTIYTGNGTLGSDRNVSSGGFTLRFEGTNNSDTLVTITNNGTSSTGLYSIGSLFGVDAQSTNVGLRAFGTSTGLLATGQNSEGAVLASNTIRGAKVASTPSSTNTIQEVLRLDRATSGVAANGIGGSVDMVVEDAGGTSGIANQIIWKWTDATNATRTSQLSVTGSNSGSLGTIFTLDGDGTMTTVGRRIISVVTSSAGTLSLGNAQYYTFTGTTTTWTLPVISGNTGVIYIIKNIGSGNITLNSNAGGNDIYDSSPTNTITISAGAARILINDGLYWGVN